MKKALLIGLPCLLCLAVGFALGQVDWKALARFMDCTIAITPPRLESHHLGGFRLSAPPDFSSDHFYFRTGFKDIDEYWSFQLPPDRAREFIDSYVKREAIPSVRAETDFPSWVAGDPENPDWMQEYWFNQFEDLSEIYYQKYLFLAYSEEKNRIYLMNWND